MVHRNDVEQDGEDLLPQVAQLFGFPIRKWQVLFWADVQKHPFHEIELFKTSRCSGMREYLYHTVYSIFAFAEVAEDG